MSASSKLHLLLSALLLFVLAIPLAAQINVLTYHNDLARTGENINETTLAPSNVNASSFGKVFIFPVDGDVYAQPLYLSNVAVPGQGSHNLLFVATEHDSVYAFDADGQGTSPVWHVSFINAATGVRPVSASGDVHCGDLTPEIGITGTPVIDPTTGTLYLVAATWENGGIVDRLHALDVATGAEKFGGPVVIQASVPGTGGASVSGMIPFDPTHAMQRPGLLLLNGSVFIAFASYCDNGTYHGWVLSYDAATLGLKNAFSPTPNDVAGGIWQSGVAPASDGTSIFLSTGNGGFDANTGGSDYGNSILRLDGELHVVDSFTPYNQQTLNQYDLDVAAAGPLLLPDQTGSHSHLMIASGKVGTLYLLDRDSMGGFHAGSDSQIVQSVPNAFRSVYGGFAYWNQTVYGAGVYRWDGATDVAKAFSLQNGQLTLSSQATTPFAFPGATPSISADGNTDGILWAVQADQYGTGPAVLHAYDATYLATELYNSSQEGTRDRMGVAVKFVVPTIANGRVYVGARDEVDVFGLLASTPPQNPDFSLSLLPASTSLPSGTNATLTVQTNPVAGETGTISFTCTAPASGCSINPVSAPVGQFATVTVAASALQTGSNIVTVSATDGTNTHQQSSTVAISSSSSGLPLPTISNLTGTSVTLSWTTAQALNTQAWYGTMQASTHVDDWKLTTQHVITLTGLQPATTYLVKTESSYYSDPDLTSQVFTVTTTGASSTPDFSIAIGPAASSVAANTAARLTLTSTAINGDSSPLTLACTVPASGCQFSPASIVPGQSASVTIAASALQSGSNTITVAASDGAVTHTASASVTAAPPASGLPLPAVVQITSSSVTLTWTTTQALNTQAWYGTSQPSTHVANWILTTQHSITLTGLQPNTTYQVKTESSYYSNPDLTSPVFTVTTLDAAEPPDFTVALSPATSSVAANTAASLTLTTTALNGDSSPLTLACTAPASGCQFSQASIVPGQSASVTIAASALQSGPNTITVAASGGAITHTTTASVTAASPTSGLPVPTVTGLTSNRVTFVWSTAQALNTQVWYGTSQPSTHIADWILTTQHSITLNGLQPNTTYQVKTESSYYSNPDLSSPVFTVTTTP